MVKKAKAESPPKKAPKIAPQRQSPPKVEIIPPELDTALRTAGVNPKNPEVSRAIEISMMMVSGTLPLPPAAILQEYEKEFPGLVEKIIGWVEQQREFRQEQERARFVRSEDRMDLGQKIAASVALLGLSLAAVVGVFGSEIVGGILAIVAVGGPTAAIILADKSPGRRTPPPSKPPPSTPPPQT